jgi:hypothetical protein
MYKRLAVVAVAVVLSLGASPVLAQCGCGSVPTTYSPAASSYTTYYTSTVTYYPPASYVTYYTPATPQVAYYAPVAQPYTTYYAPVAQSYVTYYFDCILIFVD